MTEMRVFSIDYEGDQEERARRCMRKAREAFAKWEDAESPEKGTATYREAAEDLHRGIKAASVAKAITGEDGARALLTALRDLRRELFGGTR